MTKARVVRVRGYKAVDDIRASVEKTVLYGPNGAGKTSFMEAAAYVLLASNSLAGRTLVTFSGVREGFEIEVEGVLSLSRRGGAYELRTDEGVVRAPNHEHHVLLERLESALRRAGIGPLRRAAWIDASTAYLATGAYHFHRPFGDLEPQLPLPKIEDAELLEVLEAAEDAMYDVLDISRVYKDYDRVYVKESGKWIPLSDLAYGKLRALAVIMAANFADALFIEAFESGLHGDLALSLIDYLSEFSGVAVVETHLGVIVAQAVASGWRAYYVDGGRVVRELESVSDLKDVELYRRELSAMGG